MKRFSGRFLAVVAVAVIVAMASQSAMAQNESRRGRGGRGGGPGGMMGPVPMARLATDEKVQEALKLSSEQNDKIKAINDEIKRANDEMRKEFDNGGRPDFEKRRKVMDEASEKLSKVLDEGQQKRLMGVFVQVNGPVALVDPAVEKALDLTGEQKDKLHELLAPPRGGRGDRGAAKGEGRGEAKGGEGRERGPGNFRANREKLEKEAMAVLTSDQQKKLEEMKGDKIEVDIAKLRGPGGPGGREGRGRDRGNRGEPKESKSDSQ